MPQPVTLPAPASHRPIPERIEIDDAERAEQFSAFLRARAGEDSPAANRAGQRARAFPPPARFDWEPGEGTSPPPWARAHEVANGKPFVGDAQGIEVPPPAPEPPSSETPPAETPPAETAPAEDTEPITPPAVNDAEPTPEPAADAAPADNPVEPAISADPAPETPSTSESGDAAGVETSDEAIASFAAPLTETESTFQPNTPRYQDVPNAWKWPIGTYQQAPEKFGGEWWKVNPFTGPEPWKPVESSVRNQPPEEFSAVFGPRPQPGDFDSGKAYQAARGRWDQDLAYFKQSGIPEGFDESQVELAVNVFESWGMGRPAFYEGRYGWATRFPDSGLPTFEAKAETALEHAHLIIASFQTRQLLNGIDPVERHPFVPLALRAENAKTA